MISEQLFFPFSGSKFRGRMGLFFHSFQKILPGGSIWASTRQHLTQGASERDALGWDSVGGSCKSPRQPGTMLPGSLLAPHEPRDSSSPAPRPEIKKRNSACKSEGDKTSPGKDFSESVPLQYDKALVTGFQSPLFVSPHY